ncbi:unnamed protein product [Schistocephalus solidus]|uniref:Uncharacterized protein n=1 Tax=Schistocephalus solidus TaxID=70667 RepID=A0A183T259_SCHSO|nr:unnamed protein product [Schistocephalus solidus]
MKTFRIQRGTRNEVVSANLLKAAVSDTPPDKPCGPPPPPPSIHPSRIRPLTLSPHPSTATSFSSDTPFKLYEPCLQRRYTPPSV